jgi:BirA family biotin operon repressor/biotin-[acetyl-CoA-carboxylase] ligase
MAASLDDVQAALSAEAKRLEPFGRHVAVFDVIGSTNAEAMRLARVGAPAGTIVIADAQTGGRGRAGRTWFSPPGVGLYASVLLRPVPGPHERPDGIFAPWTRVITLAAGVAAADGIRAATGIPVELKWPNDVVISEGTGPLASDRRSRKIAGILAEASAGPDNAPLVVVGFGINVGAVRYPGELALRATSLEAEAGRPVSRSTVLVETLAHFRRWYAGISEGSAADVLARWRELAPSCTGARVVMPDGDGVVLGTTAGLSDAGALRVRTPAGVEDVISGEVRWA